VNSESSTDPYGAGPVQVLPFDATGAEALGRLAGSLGLTVARVDLSGCASKDDLLGRIATALALPDWFGHNWDALFDCLAELGESSSSGCLLVLEHAGDLRREAPEVFDTLLGILSDAAVEWARRDLPLRAFVSA
jgi:RNAse (barnase) inhibitor barstar